VEAAGRENGNRRMIKEVNRHRRLLRAVDAMAAAAARAAGRGGGLDIKQNTTLLRKKQTTP